MNLVRSGRKQPQRFRAGSSASTFSYFHRQNDLSRFAGVKHEGFEFLAGFTDVTMGGKARRAFRNCFDKRAGNATKNSAAGFTFPQQGE